MSLAAPFDDVTGSSATGARPVSSAPLPAARRRLLRGFGILGSLLAVAVLWLVGSAAGADYVLSDAAGTATVTLFTAAVFALQIGLLGWLVLAVLERFATRARTIWVRLAVSVVFLAEVPIALEEATGATKLALTMLHLVVAAVLIPTLARTSSRS